MKTWFRSALMLIILVACGLVPVLAAAGAEVLDRYFVLKTSPQDQAAVVRVNDGKAKIVRVGDVVGTWGNVMEITSDSVVIEEGKGKDRVTVIIRVSDGKQAIERIQKKPPPKGSLYGAAQKGNSRSEEHTSE